MHATAIHYNKFACDWLSENQKQADVICLTGDFLDTRTDAADSLSVQVDFFLAWFRSFSIPLFICSGNHDVLFNNGLWLTIDDTHSVHADNSRTSINGIKFGCVPYGANLESFANCDVLLHHEPPSGSKTAKQNGTDLGSITLRQALKTKVLNPRYVLCGHVHKPLRLAVKIGGCVVVNAGGIHSDKQPSHAMIEVL